MLALLARPVCWSMRCGVSRLLRRRRSCCRCMSRSCARCCRGASGYGRAGRGMRWCWIRGRWTWCGSSVCSRRRGRLGERGIRPWRLRCSRGRVGSGGGRRSVSSPTRSLRGRRLPVWRSCASLRWRRGSKRSWRSAGTEICRRRWAVWRRRIRGGRGWRGRGWWGATPAARQRELEELRDFLVNEGVRLLVLTGAGGSGKTRLALEAAWATAASFANGAAFVGLAPLGDADLVVGAILEALAVQAVQGEEPLETLAGALRSRELLLVVDNAEHLRAAAPVFVELLARAPHLTLLVTSRAVLHLSGEHVYPLEPLDGEAAVELFLERAREADPGFRADAAGEGAG